jgi:hypothetical protein
MITQRTLILELSIVAILLMVLMTVLLFRESRAELPQEPTQQTQTEQQSEVQSSASADTELTPSVSQEEVEEMPLGTDVNMEFPTLDE